MLIYFGPTGFLLGFVLLGILLPVLWRRKCSFAYLVFFSIFWIYLLFLVRTVIFPFVVNWEPNSPRVLPRINLVPLDVRYCSILLKYCVIEIAGNILLTIPFGFGINFLVYITPRKILWLALATGCGFEFSQLVICLVCRSGFRSIDINDLVLNAIGVLVGYALFRAFSWLFIKTAKYLRIEGKWFIADMFRVAVQAQGGDMHPS